MKYLTKTVLCLGIVALNARSEFNTGTIIILGFSQEKIVMAADSRINWGPARYRDDQCKLIALGDKIVFATVGFSGSPTDKPQTWTSAGIAKEVFAGFVARGRLPRLQDLAEEWAQKARPLMEVDFRDKFFEVLERRGGSDFFSGIILAGSEPTGELGLLSVDILFETDMLRGPTLRHRVTVQKLTQQMQWTAGGKPEIPLAIIAGRGDVGRSRKTQLLRELRKKTQVTRDRWFALRLAEITAELHTPVEDIGGPIDLVELRPGRKPKWVKQKPACAQQQ